MAKALYKINKIYSLTVESLFCLYFIYAFMFTFLQYYRIQVNESTRIFVQCSKMININNLLINKTIFLYVCAYKLIYLLVRMHHLN